MPPSVYTKHNEKHRNGKGIFLVVSLLTAGICSLYPVACFKNYSSKEKQKLKNKITDLEHKVQEEEERSTRSSKPSFVLEALSSTRESPWESSSILARRGLSRVESASSKTTAIHRQESGPGTPTASSRPRAAATIPSQLMGGSTGANASLLMPGRSSLAEYRSQMCSLMTSTPLSMESSAPQSPLSPPTPGSQQSHHSFSTISSIASEESYASSFAFSLRRSKPDLRLLRKKSKPSQHLIRKPSVRRVAPDGPRSPSFYKPKVVEDTGLFETTPKKLTPPAPPAKPPSLTLPELLRSEPPRPLRKVQTFRSSLAQSKRTASANAPKPTMSRPILLRATPSQQFEMRTASGAYPLRLPSKASRQLRFQNVDHHSQDDPIASSPRLLSQDPDHAEVPPGTRSGKHFGKQKEKKPATRHYHDVTPPEEEPGIATTSVIYQGDSYFHTFGADTMYSKEFVPAQTPKGAIPYNSRNKMGSHAPSGRAPRGSAARNKELSEDTEDSPEASSSKKRKSSALSGLFRKMTFKAKINSSASGKKNKSRHGRGVSTSMPVSVAELQTPGIVVSPADSTSLLGRSIVPELHAPSYAAQSRIRSSDSEQSVARSPGHASSGKATSEENTMEDLPTTPFSSRSRRRKRSSSEALSPRALPRGRAQLRHKSTPDSCADSYGNGGQVSPGRPPVSVSASEARTSVKDIEAMTVTDTSRIRATASVFIVDFAATELKEKISQILTFREPILRKKSSVWKGLMHGLRKVSSVGVLSVDVDVSDEAHRLPKRSITARFSIPSLPLRASRSSINVRNRELVRKSSRGSCLLKQVDSEDEEEMHGLKDEMFGEGRHSESSPERPATIGIKAEDLIVTDFEQTPFSKRYYDSIRSEQQAIRALVDETLEEDDEAMDEVVLGFEQNVPDHLPNSPLCPLHPKHKSGGKAICPSHGRYKPTKPLPSPQHKVEIVFDTREDVAQSSTEVDGPGMLEGGMGFYSFDRRRVQNSSMGSDGAESFMVRRNVSKAWSRRHGRRSSGHRGRSLERGESAVDIRLRRHRKRKQR